MDEGKRVSQQARRSALPLGDGMNYGKHIQQLIDILIDDAEGKNNSDFDNDTTAERLKQLKLWIDADEVLHYRDKE